MDQRLLREDMVDSLEHEAKAVLETERLALAMRSVPRHEFVEGAAAYDDRAHEANGTTVLAPSTVAKLFELLAPSPGDSVLIVGGGVGYTAALAAEIVGARQVHAIDIDRRLVLTARRNLRSAGYRAVLVDRRDGAGGFPEYAPYDRILLEAAAVEPPQRLLDQLAEGGRLVMPKGTTPQELVAIEDAAVIERGDAVQFTPLLVEGEQHTAIERNRTRREDTERANGRAHTGWEYDWIDWTGRRSTE